MSRHARQLTLFSFLNKREEAPNEGESITISSDAEPEVSEQKRTASNITSATPQPIGNKRRCTTLSSLVYERQLGVEHSHAPSSSLIHVQRSLMYRKAQFVRVRASFAGHTAAECVQITDHERRLKDTFENDENVFNYGQRQRQALEESVRAMDWKRIAISSLAFDSTGELLCCTRRYGTLELHRVHSWHNVNGAPRSVNCIEEPLLQLSLQKKLTTARWNPANENEVVCAYAHQNNVDLFDLSVCDADATQVLAAPPSLSAKGVYDVHYLDGKTVVACGQNGTIRLWDARMSRAISIPKAAGENVGHLSTMCVTPCARVLHVGAERGAVLSYDIRSTLEPLHVCNIAEMHSFQQCYRRMPVLDSLVCLDGPRSLCAFQLADSSVGVLNVSDSKICSFLHTPAKRVRTADDEAVLPESNTDALQEVRVLNGRRTVQVVNQSALDDWPVYHSRMCAVQEVHQQGMGVRSRMIAFGSRHARLMMVADALNVVRPTAHKGAEPRVIVAPKTRCTLLDPFYTATVACTRPYVCCVAAHPTEAFTFVGGTIDGSLLMTSI